MLLVSDVHPAELAAIPIERVVDQLTTYGRTELEFCLTDKLGAIRVYVPHLSGKSPRFAYGSPGDIVLGAACWAFLQQRSREILTDGEESIWAVKHHWPSPERFIPGVTEEVPGNSLTDESALLSAISEGGKYDPCTAFLFNLMVVVWDAKHREFRFPDIPDYRIATACRQYLYRSGLALYDYPEQRPRNANDPFALLIDYACRHAWPEVDAFIARAALWRRIRPQERNT